MAFVMNPDMTKWDVMETCIFLNTIDMDKYQQVFGRPKNLRFGGILTIFYKVFMVNEVSGDILAAVSDGDLSLIIPNFSDRYKILRAVREYLERQSLTPKLAKIQKVSMRLEEWRRENEQKTEDSNE